MNTQAAGSTGGRVAVWSGRVLTLLLGALLLMGAVMKLQGGQQVAEGMGHLGLPAAMVRPLGILEMTCALVYLIPWTTVLGAILLTGYMGGTILAHWRVGDPFVMQIVIGVLIWLAVALRDPRLWQLIPWRRAAA